MKKKHIKKNKLKKKIYNFNSIKITVPLCIYMVSVAGSSLVGVNFLFFGDTYRLPDADITILSFLVWFFTILAFVFFMFLGNFMGVVKIKK